MKVITLKLLFGEVRQSYVEKSALSHPKNAIHVNFFHGSHMEESLSRVCRRKRRKMH